MSAVVAFFFRGHGCLRRRRLWSSDGEELASQLQMLEGAGAGGAGWLLGALDVELDGHRREEAVGRNEG